jgi:hypothetical protein
MNGGQGIERGCLLVFFVKGARTAIVYVPTVLETQNLEPDRTILFSPLSLSFSFSSLHQELPARNQPPGITCQELPALWNHPPLPSSNTTISLFFFFFTPQVIIKLRKLYTLWLLPQLITPLSPVASN